MIDEKNPFGLTVARCREERGLSQAALAREVGISRPYLTQIENGARLPSDTTAMKIMAALDISWESFMTEHLQGILSDDQLMSLGHLTRSYDVLQQFLSPEQLETLADSYGSFEQLDASLRNLQGEPMPPGPEGWLELSKNDRRLVQRLVNRLRDAS